MMDGWYANGQPATEIVYSFSEGVLGLTIYKSDISKKNKGIIKIYILIPKLWISILFVIFKFRMWD